MQFMSLLIHAVFFGFSFTAQFLFIQFSLNVYQIGFRMKYYKSNVQSAGKSISLPVVGYIGIKV